MNIQGDGFSLKESITEIRDDIKGIRDDLGLMRAEIAVLKVKAGIWGALGGLIPAAIAIGYMILKAMTSA